MNYYRQLSAAFPQLTFSSEVPLAPMTTVKLGGPAEVLFVAEHSSNLIEVVQFCCKSNIPFTLLGWGANTLIADRGIRGLVIHNKTKEVSILTQKPSQLLTAPIQPRFSQLDDKPSTFQDLDYNELEKPKRTITVASGAPVSWLIQHCLQLGLTGLQWYSRIPATLGGAVVNNIHGGSHFISELVESVVVITDAGKNETWPAKQLEFGYDTSVFHHSQAIISSVNIQLFQGDVTRAQNVIEQWARQKKHQPQNSLGCIFHNLTATEQAVLSLPTPSTGFFIDKVLHLSGFQIGGAQISTQHAAFIQTTAGATAEDYLAVIKHISQAATKHKVKLKLEIFFKGFTQTELSDIL